MKRLFLRTYVGLVITYVLALMVGARLLYRQPFTTQADVYQRTYGGGMSLAIDRLAAAPPQERPAVLDDLRGRFRFPMRIVPWDSDEIDAEARAVLARGARFAEWFDVRPGKGTFLIAPLTPNAEILCLGPLPGSTPPTFPRWGTVIAGVGITLLTGAWLLLWPIAKQFRALEDAARRLQNGDLDARASEASASTRPLARAFNGMAADLHRRIDAQRDLLRTVSHELRTPLARIRFAIDRLAGTESAAARAAQLEEIDGDLSELDELVDELLTWSRLDAGAPPLEPLAMDTVFRDLESAFPDIELDDIEEGLTVRGDRRLLVRALSNLVANAQRHAKSHVRIAVSRDAQCVRVAVEDDGPGIPPHARERVFEPFVRLAPEEGRGVGLGLAIVRRIVDRHGGAVRIEDAARGGGCRVVLELPSVAPA